MSDAVRLAFGTLTILPVRPPRLVDRRTAGRAMVLAPVVGLVLAAVPALVLSLVGERAPLLAAALAVAVLTVSTRGLHLDGLADTADGLGSGLSAERALAVMRRGDVGPFGVVTVVLALVLQVAALAELVSRDIGAQALTTALVVSRLVLPLLCTTSVPAARTDGLGSVVAGSVRPRGVAVAVLVAAVAVVLVTSRAPLAGALTTVAALVVAGLLCRRCVRRLGGVTGDVLGACVEVAFTTALVVACL